MNNIENLRIAVIGLGYVGLPLAVEFGKQFEVVGFDVSEARVKELLAGHDATMEIGSDQLKSSKNLIFSTDVS